MIEKAHRFSLACAFSMDGGNFMKWKKDEIIHGFQVKDMGYVHEISADAYILEHVKSGAKLMYIDSEDDNKVFYICFRTTPDNSKGIPHILEHSTLCGSRKYNLKEPFVELAKGSLNTFLNAITWPDKTMYPVASRNAVDFRNLMDVYLDAVFYPHCLTNPQILMQEGWHYELDAKEGELTYNGVVYNEMKGALSSPEALLEDAAMEKLFPDNTYSVESGGDPEVIPTLSMKEFTEFYHRFYHPSNSYIYLYGDMNIEETLAYLDEEYLNAFDRRIIDSAVQTQDAFAKPVVTEQAYGIAAGESERNKAIHALYTAMTDHMSTKESLAFRILLYVLVEMDGAPLRKALLDAKLGSDVVGNYEESYKQPVWSIEITGSEPDKQGEFSHVVTKTLRNVATHGIDKKMLDAALNRTEFISREGDYQGRPKGLFYGVRVMQLWLYDKNPISALRYENDIKALREEIDSGYFENLILKYLLKNPHQVLITMKAEKGLTEKKNEELAQKLADYKKSLSAEQLEEIINSTRLLKERQASMDDEEDLKSIPLLERKDLNRPIDDVPLLEDTLEGIHHYHAQVDTHGISYINLYFKTVGIEVSDVFYLNILAQLLMSMDTKKSTYAELVRRSNAHTGGIKFSFNVISDVEDEREYTPYFVVKGKSLTTQIQEMFPLIGEILSSTVYEDKNRLKEILSEEKSAWDMTVFDQGHALTMLRLSSYFSETGKVGEQSGLSYYYFLADLMAHFDEKFDELVWKLKTISEQIFTKANLIVHSTGLAEEKNAIKETLPQLLALLPEGEALDFIPWNLENKEINEAFLTSGKVQYVTKGSNFRRHGFTYTGAIPVMETILRYEYLWKKVRVLGGAYGAFTQFTRNGNAMLCSYRDPNLAETLEIYKNLPSYLETFTLSEREMTKYVIGTMAAFETQLTPSMKGERAFLYRMTHNTKEAREKIREEIIRCQVEDIRNLAPMIMQIMDDPYICVMGGEEKIQKNKNLFRSVLSMPK